MAIVEKDGQPWTRKHDDPSAPVVPSAPRTLYPQTLEDLIAICRGRAATERIHAAGSHWALSEAAISDSVFVESHDPANLERTFGRTLYDIVPLCLSADFLSQLAAITVPPFDADHVGVNQGLYPVHIEAGKRIYQLYAELDFGDDGTHSPGEHTSLADFLAAEPYNNPTYRGPWAFPSLGGAGGQTVLGALITGTHGGDFQMPPIADAVLAIHLVADGGKHYWIERSSGVPGFEANLTDDDQVKAFYGQDRFGGPDNFELLRDDDLFNAVVISAGRFGIVYSIVLGAVRQYSLHEHRALTKWSAVKNEIAKPIDTTQGLYGSPDGVLVENRFLQVVVCVTPHGGFSENLVGVTKRWNVPLVANSRGEPAGRPERVGSRGSFDALIQARRYSNAGSNFVYSPDPDHPGNSAQNPSFLELACSDGNIVAGVIDAVRVELENFVASNGKVIGAIMLAVTVAGGGALVVGLIAAFIAVIAILALLAAAIRSTGDLRLGQVLNETRSKLLDNPDPAARAAGLLTWQMIVYATFSSQQADRDYGAISYAVMDGHDYRDRSCSLNVQSIEVFFEATDPMLIAYVDELLAFEVHQEIFSGKAFSGYISLRFTGKTNALIGPEQFERTCAVEVAGLRDVDGTTELVDFAIRTALNPNFSGILHWGQRNESVRAEIEDRFGDSATNPSGPLHTWRQELAFITDNGRLDGFSSAFTRRTGLEVVAPAVGFFQAVGSKAGNPIHITWDCTNNPPGAQVSSIAVRAPDESVTTFALLPLAGSLDAPTTVEGDYLVTLTLSLVVDGIMRKSVSSIIVHVTPVIVT